MNVPAWAVIVCAGTLAHGMLPLTDYLLWDGWWYAADLVQNEGVPTMTRLFHEVGRPLDMMFYAPMRLWGGDPVLWAKWLGPIAWIASGVCVKRVLQISGGLSPDSALAIAVLAVTSPVFDLLGELSLWMNTACVFLFWAGWVLFGYRNLFNGWPSYLIRVCALVVLFLSFNLNSNLVMFYAVAAMLVGMRCVNLPRHPIRARLWQWVTGNGDFVALPIAFWIWKTVFTPTSGYYAEGYNQPSLEPIRFVYGYAAMAAHFLFPGLIELFASGAWLGVTVAAAIVVGIMLSKGAGWAHDFRGVASAWMVVWGTVLLAAAAFPYLAVGQQLASEGWLSRNAILCNVPLATIAVGGLAMVNAKASPSIPWLWVVGVTVVAVLGIGNCHRNYLALQAFGVKERSVQRKLSAAISEYDACVVQLRDYFDLPGTIAYYPPSIWTFIGSGTASAPKAFVVDTRVIAQDQVSTNEQGQMQVTMPQLELSAREVDQAITATTMPYAMENIHRSGPQLLFAILPGSLGNQSVRLGIRYLGLKLSAPAQCEDFEKCITDVRVVPLRSVRE